MFADLFSNAVTFRITDAIITLPMFDLGHSGDIYFEFKTTRENAVLLHSKVTFIINFSLNLMVIFSFFIYIYSLPPYMGYLI